MIVHKPLIAVDLREACESPRPDLLTTWRSFSSTPQQPNHSAATQFGAPDRHNWCARTELVIRTELLPTERLASQRRKRGSGSGRLESTPCSRSRSAM